jgi:hypothetical protein
MKKDLHIKNLDWPGLKYKNQDLTARILKGGRTGLQKYKSSRALKQNGQPSAVDLRSNGHGHTRAPWTAPCARRTGPRWTAPFKRRGTRSRLSVQDLMALDVCTRWAAAASPETGAARRCLAGKSPAHPILLLRAPSRAHVGSTRSWVAYEQA